MARNADALRQARHRERALARHTGPAQGQHRHGDRCKPAQGRSRSWACPRLRDSTVEQTCAPAAPVILPPPARPTCRSGRTSGLSNRSAAGPGVVGRRTIRTHRSQPLRGPALARALRRQRISPRSRLAARRTAARVSANANGVVGIKPTVGLTSRAGVGAHFAHTGHRGSHGRQWPDAERR